MGISRDDAAKRNAQDDGTDGNTVYVKPRKKSRRPVYHNDRDCGASRSDRELVEYARQKAQLRGYAACKLCVIGVEYDYSDISQPDELIQQIRTKLQDD